ncbi:sensor histidine kinase [Emticicia sp. 17c]|uniref:sensor histidine kinase n=1 Tax=Emticicia sp. 17c TaxID=3127704 RepID=UPI00301B9A1C
MDLLTYYKKHYLDAPAHKRQKVRIAYHLAFWLFFIVNNLTYIFISTDVLSRVSDPRATIILTFVYYFRYVLIYYLIIATHNFFNDKLQLARLIVLDIFASMFYFHTITYLMYYIFDIEIGIQGIPGGYKVLGLLYLSINTANFTFQDLIAIIFTGFKEFDYMLIAIVLKLVKTIFEKELLLNKLQVNSLKMELRVLRAQINPHFVFNVINAAYAKILPVDEKSSEYLLKTSDILRFTLYETEEDFIELQKELDCIEKYIELEHIRHEERLKLHFNIKGSPKEGQQIPTLLLLTLVENAFKHGTHSSRQESWIDIQIKITDNKLSINIKNSKPPHPKFKNKKDTNEGGLGLVNLRKRLEVFYKKNHQFIIEEKDREFAVFVEIPLSEIKERKPKSIFIEELDRLV